MELGMVSRWYMHGTGYTHLFQRIFTCSIIIDDDDNNNSTQVKLISKATGAKGWKERMK